MCHSLAANYVELYDFPVSVLLRAAGLDLPALLYFGNLNRVSCCLLSRPQALLCAFDMAIVLVEGIKTLLRYGKRRRSKIHRNISNRASTSNAE